MAQEPWRRRLWSQEQEALAQEALAQETRRLWRRRHGCPLAPAPVAEGSDQSSDALRLSRRWRSTGSKGTVVARWGLALNATESRGEAGVSEEALEWTVLSDVSSRRDILDASRAHSSLSSRPSLHVSSHSAASGAAAVGLRSFSGGGAAGVRSCSVASCLVRAWGCKEGANTCRNETARCVRFQCPRGKRGSKEEVSRPSDDKTLFPCWMRACSRTAGEVRWPVVGSWPGRRPITRETQGAVTPSVHLGVPDALSVTPGPGMSIRQQLGWKKVHETARSGIWVLKGESRGYALSFNLEYLGVAWMKMRTHSTAWVTPRHRCLCTYEYGRAAVGPQFDDSIWNGVMELWSRVAPLLTPWYSER